MESRRNVTLSTVLAPDQKVLSKDEVNRMFCELVNFLHSDVCGTNNQGHMHLGPAETAFRAAAFLFRECQFDASVIMSRDAIDAAIFQALSETKAAGNHPMTLDLHKVAELLTNKKSKWRNYDWRQLESWLGEDENSRLFSFIVDDVRKVRDYGNFAAHLAESTLRSKLMWAANQRILSDVDSTLVREAAGSQWERLRVDEGYKQNTSPKEASEALNVSQFVIMHVASIMQYSVFKQSPPSRRCPAQSRFRSPRARWRPTCTMMGL
jgi:hypothetical protein